MAVVRDLCGIENRLAGTDAERRAGNMLARRLADGGRKVRVEPTYVHPQAPLIIAVHLAIAFAGSLVAVSEPVIGFALVLFAATSLYLDLNARLYLLRTLFFRRASQNVVAPGTNPGASARVLLVAHYDAARSGLIYSPKNAERLRSLTSFLPFPHTRLLFWSVAALLPMLGARMAGVESDGIALLQLPPTLTLLVATFLLVDIQLSRVVPGANDNASGVAVALSVAAAVDESPAQNVDVWVVLTGGEECGMEGMRSFARAHRDSLDLANTYVVALDSVGSGDIRYVVSEGLTVSFEMDRRLEELCDAVAEADREGANRYRASPLRHGYATDALAARIHGMRATTITSLEPGAIAPARHHTQGDTPSALDDRTVGRAHDFTLDLIRALDREAGRTRPAG